MRTGDGTTNGDEVRLFLREISLPSGLEETLSEAGIEIHEYDDKTDSGDHGCLLLPATSYEEVTTEMPAILVLEGDEELRETHENGTVEYLHSSDIQNRPGLVLHRLEEFVDAQRATDRKEKTVQTLANYRELFDAAPDTVLIHEEDGTIVDVNQTAVDTLGYTRAELLSMGISDIEVGVDRAELVDAWRDLPTDEPLTVEGRHRHADGSEHPVEAWVTRSAIEGESLFIAIARDITERREYERTLEEQRDNLETLNQVVRHDIRNDLQLVDIYADLLEDHVGEDGQDHLDKLQDAVANAVDLTTTARQLAQVMLQDDLDHETIRLDTMLIDQVEDIRETHPSASITVEDIPGATVVGNEMLSSVFRNLLKNGIQHNDKETPRVAVFATEHDDSVEIAVADNGPGVPDEQKSDIFGRGQKGLESDGTGIGLYLVQSLVTNIGGEVWVEDRDSSQPPETDNENAEEGTVFVVELPRSTV
jgi:PAS domain S-box-containing protein